MVWRVRLTGVCSQLARPSSAACHAVWFAGRRGHRISFYFCDTIMCLLFSWGRSVVVTARFQSATRVKSGPQTRGNGNDSGHSRRSRCPLCTRFSPSVCTDQYPAQNHKSGALAKRVSNLSFPLTLRYFFAFQL